MANKALVYTEKNPAQWNIQYFIEDHNINSLSSFLQKYQQVIKQAIDIVKNITIL